MNDERRDPLIEAIIQKQRELGETDLLFSRRIGMSRQAWQLIRNGGTPGPRTLHGVVEAFPELRPYVVAFLLDRNASKVTSAASTVASEAV